MYDDAPAGYPVPSSRRVPDAENPAARRSAMLKLAMLRKRGYTPKQFGIQGDVTAQYRALSPLLGAMANIRAGVPGQYETPEGTNEGVAARIAKMRSEAQVRNAMEGRQFPQVPGLGPEEGLGASVTQQLAQRLAGGPRQPGLPQIPREAQQQAANAFVGREGLPGTGGLAQKLAGSSNREMLNAIARARSVSKALKHLRKLRPARPRTSGLAE